MIATYFAIGIAMYLLGKMVGFESGWHQGHDYGKAVAESERFWRHSGLDDDLWRVDGFDLDTARLEK